MEFKKASLQEVSPKPSPSPAPVGEPIAVQINPATLRLTMANNVDTGKAFSRPNTQYQGTSSSTLAFDLVFDTADEGTTEEPIDVRTRTRQLERFLLPSSSTAKAVPPRVQFTYGSLVVVGVMTALNVEFDLFAANAVPLRAKCSVTIKEQKPEFDAKLAGPGANTGAGATPPVPPAAAAGGSGEAPGAPSAAGPDGRTGTALDGESAADFANRMGLDPRAWKGLAARIPDPLRLAAGQLIDFDSRLSVDTGLGRLEGAVARLGQRGGGDREPATSAGDAGPVPARPPATGAELTASGGLTRALDRASVVRTEAAAAASRAAFAGPGPSTDRPTPPPGSPAAAVSPPPSPVSAVQTADPRATSYGYSVPLRPRRGPASTRATGLVHERGGSMPPTTGGLPSTDDPTVPRWEAVPAPSAGAPATAAGAGRAAAGGCGCGCGGAGR